MNLPLLPGSLDDPNCWPSSPQAFYNETFAKGVAIASSITGVIISDTEPAITDRDKLWIRTSGNAPVFPLGWLFYSGLWVAKHPIAAGTQWAFPYIGTLASIATLDGGAAGVVSDNSGPFWEVIAAMAARVPIGAGALPSGPVLVAGDTGGSDEHTLTTAEMPKHTHLLVGNENVDTGAVTATQRMAQSGGTGNDEYGLTGSNLDASIALSGETGGDTPFTNLPPYYTVNFLRRTARVFCTQPIA